jgi:hypothetical protein
MSPGIRLHYRNSQHRSHIYTYFFLLHSLVFWVSPHWECSVKTTPFITIVVHRRIHQGSLVLDSNPDLWGRNARQQLSFAQSGKTVAEFTDPWLGYKVNSSIGFLYRPASHVAWRGVPVRQPYAGVDFIPPVRDLWIRQLDWDRS